MAGGNFCGSELRHIQRPNGPPISSLRLAAGSKSSIPNPGSRWCIRRDIYPPRSIDRHSRPPDVSAFTLAKRIRRTLIGSVRRECLDHIVVFGERHLRHVLLSYMDCYNGTRTHLSLNKDAPISRAAEAAGRILCRPILGGLHPQYARGLFAVGTVASGSKCPRCTAMCIGQEN